MPKGAKMSLALNEPKLVALHPDSITTLKHAPLMENILSDVVCKTTNRKS
jgi:hypothetical protein